METNKYYTPTIEEFHVGFEYERMDGGEYYKNICNAYDISSLQTIINKQTLVNIQKDSYCQKEYGIKALDNTTYNKYKTTVKLGRIRVKYLDREDIESLGWNKKTFHNKQYFLMDFYLEDLNDNHFAIFSGYQEDITFLRLFTGEIKNKSELKKIMRQIDIKTN